MRASVNKVNNNLFRIVLKIGKKKFLLIHYIQKKEAIEKRNFFNKFLKEYEEQVVRENTKGYFLAGYLFEGNFYSDLKKLKGRTFSEKNKPEPLYQVVKK
jgi:hypothetical protein